MPRHRRGPEEPPGPPRRPGHPPPAPPAAGLMVPCVLVLLLRCGELHGYALRDELEGRGLLSDVDFGNLYRTLRRMEDAGLVTSRWEVEAAGPGRRVYALAPAGERHLAAGAEALQQLRERLDRFFGLFGDAQTDGSGQG